ncbi:LacI family DNA-binding transcriptional regulator [Enterococcus sp.]|uniref:LacI family DNA-binding transcriptional regulator n=1 Tax=Enterococcus sp. TaxID=35783 RepID=UPI003C76093E
MSAQRITIRDVAKQSGYSIATVSKALNGVDVVKPYTKQKIIEAAEKLHYVPNLMGKQLKNAQTKMIGFYTTSISGPYFSILVEVMAREAEKHGYGINVFISYDKKIVLNSILGSVVDGIIGFEDLLSPQDLEAIKREGIKAVFIDRDVCSDTIGSVVFDSLAKGRQATKTLLDLGHRRIGFIKGVDGVYDADGRLAGYQQALAEAGIPLDETIILTGLFEEQAAFESVTAYLETNPDHLPTAFLAGNDLSGIGCVKALQKKGYQVPADFSVMGFDGIDLLEYFTPRMSTVRNPIKEQGMLAVRHLLALINQTTKGKAYVLEGTVTIRESTSKRAEE